ncbi:hypothetical protein I7I48_00721 [Histoplasma ohiense]|nr:hypothetical protein I7I48_00721 [Histoplasma ohiense (nom. inval.)]
MDSTPGPASSCYFFAEFSASLGLGIDSLTDDAVLLERLGIGWLLFSGNRFTVLTSYSFLYLDNV